MVDPLSITASIASILGVCINVSIQLRTFLKGASEVRTTITAMLTDVKAMRHVLQSMEDTFEAMDGEKPQTGHIGAHWDNLSRSLDDGKNSLIRLENLLRDTNRDVPVLDAPRRQARLKTVAEQLANFRQEVQTYKDALQLSLQTIIFWSEIEVQKQTARIMNTSDEMYQDIQRLATNVDIKLTALHRMFEELHQHGQLSTINNLRNTVRSAATVISSASTALSADEEVSEEIREEFSDFGDWFKPEISQSTLNWIYSGRRDEPLFDCMGHNPESNRANMPSATDQSQAPKSSSVSFTTYLVGNNKPHASEINEVRQRSPLENEESPPASSTEPACSRHERPTEVIKAPPTTSPRRRTSWFRKSSVDVKGEPRTSRKVDSESNGLFTLPSSSTEKLPNTINEERIVLLDPKKSKFGRKKRTQNFKRIKFVLVGDGACGKTSLITVGTIGTFPTVYDPTVFDNYITNMEIDRDLYEVHLWDTAGQEEYERLRAISYPDTDAFILCFSMDNPDTLANVLHKWAPEVNEFDAAVPKFIVGCKKDLRHDATITMKLLKHDSPQHPVTRTEGEEAAKEVGAAGYFECSALTAEGVREVFYHCIGITVERSGRTGDSRQKRRRGPFKWLFQ